MVKLKQTHTDTILKNKDLFIYTYIYSADIETIIFKGRSIIIIGICICKIMGTL